MSCRHVLSDGLGMYGDALTCIKCGISFYDDRGMIKIRYIIKGRFLSCTKYPWVVDAANAATGARKVRETKTRK